MKNKNLSGGLFVSGKPQPLTICETSLSAQIAEWLDALRVYNDRLQCGQFQTPSGHWMRGSKKGTPDRFAIIRGQIIFIEVKKRGEKSSADQRIKHNELRDSGAIVIVADSFDYFQQTFSAIRAAVEDSAKRGELYD